MALQLEKLSSARLLGLSRERTVFFFAVGPFEDHGFHLPVGLDLLEADRMAQMTAERLEKEMPGWTAVIFPRSALGIDSNTTSLALTVRAHVLRDYLVDTSLALAKHGFRYFACFTGQLGPKQLTAIEEAGKIIRRRARGPFPLRLLSRRSTRAVFVSASSVMVAKGDSLRSLFWPDPKEHGGARDTSLALHLVPEAVDPAYSAAIPRNRSIVKFARAWSRARGQLSGYWGSPAAANATSGKIALLEQTDRVFLKLRAVWEGANSEGIFRSWYSIFPPNWSFFKAWVLLFLFLLVLAGWLYLTFRSMTGG